MYSGNPVLGPRQLQTPKVRNVSTDGVSFPATQVASSDANTLDDYEEAAWVPTDGSGAGLSLTVTKAKVTKIGRQFTIFLDVTYPATASGAAAQINGCPFTDADKAIGGLYTNGAGGGVVAQLSGAVINFYAPGGVPLTNANLTGAIVRTTITGMV